MDMEREEAWERDEFDAWQDDDSAVDDAVEF